jgi:hypothetical protein
MTGFAAVRSFRPTQREPALIASPSRVVLMRIDAINMTRRFRRSVSRVSRVFAGRFSVYRGERMTLVRFPAAPPRKVTLIFAGERFSRRSSPALFEASSTAV